MANETPGYPPITTLTQEREVAEADGHQELQLTPVSEIKNQLQAHSHQAVQLDGTNDSLSAQADRYVDSLLNLDAKSLDEKRGKKASVENMGVELQKKAAQASELLKQPLKKLTETSQDGSDVGNALINLKMKVEELDPGKFDFEDGWLARTMGRLPGVGTPIKRYFSKFESAQTAIAAIIRSLEQGREQLKRDNFTLMEDQKRMYQLTLDLEKTIQLGKLIDQKLEYRLSREVEANPEKTKFVQEELMFPLRQRLMDLEQQLAVNQQGVLATEVIIRNNKELIRGVDRALNVTISALHVAATVAMALANQKIVLDKIEAVNKTTSDLISGTAAKLKTQGVEIQKRAASTQLDMNALKSSFQDIREAMDNLSQYRIQALPQMAQTINELDQLTGEAKKSIEKMQDGNRVRPEIEIAVED